MTDEQIAKVFEALGGLKSQIESIERAVSGNGMPGLKQKVEILEANQNKAAGAIGLLMAFGGILWAVLEYVFHFVKGGK
jgi:hypothetical protein